MPYTLRERIIRGEEVSDAHSIYQPARDHRRRALTALVQAPLEGA